jgi:hypothetical protein
VFQTTTQPRSKQICVTVQHSMLGPPVLAPKARASVLGLRCFKQSTQPKSKQICVTAQHSMLGPPVLAPSARASVLGLGLLGKPNNPDQNRYVVTCGNQYTRYLAVYNADRAEASVQHSMLGPTCACAQGSRQRPWVWALGVQCGDVGVCSTPHCAAIVNCVATPCRHANCG